MNKTIQWLRDQFAEMRGQVGTEDGPEPKEQADAAAEAHEETAEEVPGDLRE